MTGARCSAQARVPVPDLAACCLPAAAQAVNKRGGEVLSVAPGQSWSVVLLAPETCDWLVDLLAALAPSHMQHGQGGHHGHMALPAHQQALAANARQLLVAFCSLSGEVLPRRVKPVTARAQASGPSQQEVQGERCWGRGGHCRAAPRLQMQASRQGSGGRAAGLAK